MSIQLDAKEMLWRANQALQKGEEKIYTAAFKNDQKEDGDKKPLYKNDHLAIWKATKKAEQESLAKQRDNYPVPEEQIN